MKKVITMIGILVIASALLCACTTNGDLGKHVHSFSSEWSYNAAVRFFIARAYKARKSRAAFWEIMYSTSVTKCDT